MSRPIAKTTKGYIQTLDHSLQKYHLMNKRSCWAKIRSKKYIPAAKLWQYFRQRVNSVCLCYFTVALVNSKTFRETFSALLHAIRIYIVQCIVDADRKHPKPEEVGQAGRKASWVPVPNCARDCIDSKAVVE